MMEKSDDWHEPPDSNDNSQLNNRMAIEPERQRALGLFSGLDFFTFVGNFGIVLSTVLFFDA